MNGRNFPRCSRVLDWTLIMALVLTSLPRFELEARACHQTALRESEEQMRCGQAHLQAVTDSPSDAIYVIDAPGRSLQSNAGSDLFGFAGRRGGRTGMMIAGFYGWSVLRGFSRLGHPHEISLARKDVS